jgi:hypothetical protein
MPIHSNSEGIMATLIRHRSGTYYLVLSQSGKRGWRSLHARDRKAAYRMFLIHDQNSGEKEPLTLVQAQRMTVKWKSVSLESGTLTVESSDEYRVKH